MLFSHFCQDEPTYLVEHECVRVLSQTGRALGTCGHRGPALIEAPTCRGVGLGNLSPCGMRRPRFVPEVLFSSPSHAHCWHHTVSLRSL